MVDGMMVKGLWYWRSCWTRQAGGKLSKFVFNFYNIGGLREEHGWEGV